MSKTPLQLRQLTNLPARNLIINGNFDFWQRGTIGSATNNSNFFLADRWRLQQLMTSTVTVDRSADVPTVLQTNFQPAYSIKFTNSASPGSTNFMNIRYVVEGYDYASIHNKPIRLQFWVKASLTGIYTVRFGNTSGTRTYLTNITINSANTWEQKVIDIRTDSTGAWLFDNSAGLRLIINLQAPLANQSTTLNTWFDDTNSAFASTSQANWGTTSNATFYLAQVALYEGQFDSSLNISFKRAANTIQQELAMCQRYCIKLGGSVAGIATGRLDTSNSAYFGIVWPTTMRGTPSVISSTGTDGWTTSTTAGANGVNGTITAASIDANGGYMNNVTIGGGGGPGTAVVITGQGAGSLLLLSAEL